MRIDLTGKRFGRLTVKYYAGNDKYRQALWLCRCDCGNEKIVSGFCLRRGDVHSCGCIVKNAPAKNSLKLAGQRFGRLLVIRRITHSKKDYSQWLCRCDCGKEIVVKGKDLTSGKTKSCGCLQRDKASQIAIDIIEKTHVLDTDISIIKSQRPYKNNKTGKKGVFLRTKGKQAGMFGARLTCQGVDHFLGNFTSLSDAIAARKAAEKKYFEPLIEKAREML